LPINEQDEFTDYHSFLQNFATNDGDTLDRYFADLTQEERSSFMGLRQVRKVTMNNGKTIPRQYLRIQRRAATQNAN
jgi:hypothetical protein